MLISAAQQWVFLRKRPLTNTVFTREDQDNFAIESLNRANKAIADGSFEWEITPVPLNHVVAMSLLTPDEQPGNAKPDHVRTCPTLQKDGSVTAANTRQSLMVLLPL